MKRIFILLLLSITSICAIHAVKAYPGLITKIQPDGTTISYYIRGDESFNYKTTEDGYMLIENINGVFEYADFVKPSKRIISTGVKAKDIKKRSIEDVRFLSKILKVDNFVQELSEKVAKARKSKYEGEIKKIGGGYPLHGSPKSLVILVNFQDKKFTSPTVEKDYFRLLNEKGYSDNGGTGCAVDYFEASSFGQFSPKFVVVGPYTLPHPMSYYGENRSYGDARAGNMIVDACSAADEEIDFKEYDTNNDGKIDNVFVYFAGHNEAEGGGDNTVWPHRSVVVTPYNFDGVRLYDYACTSEFKGASGNNMCGIGTFCHEFGHVLGLPDFYSTDYSTTHPTLETWDIMDAGSYNNGGCTPPAYSALERFFLGWMTPKQLLTGGKYRLPALVESNEAYLVANEPHNLKGNNPNPKDFFLLENRQRIGADLFVPGTGLLITHVVFDKAKWDDNSPNNDPKNMGAEILCAFGTTANPKNNTYPGPKKVTTCKFVLRDGTELSTPLINIKEENKIISFDYPLGSYPTLDILNEPEPFSLDYGQTASQILEFKGTNISDSISIKIRSSSSFRIREHTNDNKGKYTSSLYIKPELDSTVNFKLDILFDPRVCSYGEYITDNIYFKAGDFDLLKVMVKGQSMKPIIVIPPVLKDFENITPYAFTAQWNNVVDATEYYISVYSISKEISKEIEEFTDFDKKIPSGWKSTFNNVNDVDYASKPHSVEFLKATDTLISKKYFMPVSDLQFWLHAKNTNGVFYVDGRGDDNNWINIRQISISPSVRNKYVNINNLKEKSFTQFRMYYTPSAEDGSLSFDNFTAQFTEKINYVLKDSLTYDTLLRVNGLVPETTYYCRVKASDKDTAQIPPRFENITEYSDIKEVKTLSNMGVKIEKELFVINNGNGIYTVYVPDFKEKYSVFIYSLDGHLVKVINSDSDSFEISGLINGNIYILKYAERGNMRRKTQVTKLFYNVKN